MMYKNENKDSEWSNWKNILEAIGLCKKLKY